MDWGGFTDPKFLHNQGTFLNIYNNLFTIT